MAEALALHALSLLPRALARVAAARRSEPELMRDLRMLDDLDRTLAGRMSVSQSTEGSALY